MTHAKEGHNKILLKYSIVFHFILEYSQEQGFKACPGSFLHPVMSEMASLDPFSYIGMSPCPCASFTAIMSGIKRDIPIAQHNTFFQGTLFSQHSTEQIS